MNYAVLIWIIPWNSVSQDGFHFFSKCFQCHISIKRGRFLLFFPHPSSYKRFTRMRKKVQSTLLPPWKNGGVPKHARCLLFSAFCKVFPPWPLYGFLLFLEHKALLLADSTTYLAPLELLVFIAKWIRNGIANRGQFCCNNCCVIIKYIRCSNNGKPVGYI